MGTKSESSAAGPGTDDLLPTRRSLLSRLKDWRDDTSWQEFFDTYWRLIYNVALKAGLTPAEAEEVVQETMLSVAKKMKEFHYDPARGAFKGWLLQLTGWRITNQFNKRRAVAAPCPVAPGMAGTGTEAREPVAEGAVRPELERWWEVEWQQNLWRAAMERVQRRVNPRDFQIFDLCTVKGRPLQEIRRFFGVSAMQVYLARHRVGRLVRKEIGRLKDRML
jgi:RNA polymerase sigma-70 factor (ECF subfamily)